MILALTPAFYTSKVEKARIPNKKVSFSGGILPTEAKNDVFLPSATTSQYLSKTYNNIKNELGFYTEKDIESIAAKINEEFPDLSREEILKIMEKLSSFSSYKSMDYIAKELRDKGFLGIYDFAYELTYKHKIVKDENNKNFFARATPCPKIITQIPRAFGVPLGCIMEYLIYGKYAMDYAGKKLALVFDKNTIKQLENIKKSSPADFHNLFLKNDTFIAVYIDDFENSYNFLNQGTGFGEAVKDFVKKYRKIRKENPEFSAEKITDIVLNGENLLKIKELGFSPMRIKKCGQEQANAQKIAQNLNPVIPSKEDFERIINDISQKSDPPDPNLTSKLILDYLNTNLAVYSPRSLSQKLQSLRQMIEKSVKSKGYPEKNIYYTVLNPNKSFGLIAYQFQKANNIPDEKIVYWNGFGYQAEPDFNPPEKSTIVILDDCFISGNTVLYEMFDYPHEAFALKSARKDINIIFAGVLGTDYAINRIQKNINHAKRANQDGIICADKRKINKSDKTTSQLVLDFLKFIRPDGKIFATTAVVFPFMGSDTNSPGLRPLFASFVPNRNYLHNEIKTVDFFCD